uniref:Uncharacterized protein n=1 Tax=Rhizophora mucronata TaxID=61149 RepID=A0A2P2PS08_RHIMU
MCDPWADIRQITTLNNGLGIDEASQFASDGSFIDGQFRIIGGRRLERKKSFRRLPRMWLCRFRGISFRLRLRRLQILIRGKTFSIFPVFFFFFGLLQLKPKFGANPG